MKNNKGAIGLILILLLGTLLVGRLFVWYTNRLTDAVPDISQTIATSKNNTEKSEKTIADKMDQIKELDKSKYTHEGLLIDVTGGNATGTAYTVFSTSGYNLMAEFADLPDLEEGFFYEGWVVRKDPLDTVSTGELELKDGELLNNFDSILDLTDHVFYVLTLEPDDSDPAPAEHILEGTLEKI